VRHARSAIAFHEDLCITHARTERSGITAGEDSEGLEQNEETQVICCKSTGGDFRLPTCEAFREARRTWRQEWI
jgi:hypothetical protein